MPGPSAPNSLKTSILWVRISRMQGFGLLSLEKRISNRSMGLRNSRLWNPIRSSKTWTFGGVSTNRFTGLNTSNSHAIMPMKHTSDSTMPSGWRKTAARTGATISRHPREMPVVNFGNGQFQRNTTMIHDCRAYQCLDGNVSTEG